MEVGPVTGIRGVSLLRPLEAEVLVLPATAVEPTGRTGDDAYSASSETPDRDIEGEVSVEVDPASCESDCRVDILA